MPATDTPHNMQNSILVIGRSPYPFGCASAARMRLLTLGLQAAGASVRYVGIVEPPDGLERCTTYHYKGVPYEYWGRRREAHECLSTRATRATSECRWVRRRLADYLGEHQVKAVITSGSDALTQYPLQGAARQQGSILIADVVEWFSAFAFRYGWASFRALSHEWCMRRTYLSFDGIIGISNYICNYYRKRGVPTIRVPSLADVDGSAAPIEENDALPLLVGYYGTWSRKDGVADLFAAIKILHQRGAQVRLLMAGRAGLDWGTIVSEHDPDSDPVLKRAVRNLGEISQEEIPRVFAQCNAFVLSRPLQRFSKAGMPQKLPEYMMMGRPVVVTRVGDIPEYVKDGEDGILVPPGDARAFADGIERLITHSSRKRLGEHARETARRVFNYRTHGLRLAAFVHVLLRQHGRI